MTRSTARLHIVADEPTERVRPSDEFLRLTRNPALASPKRFQATEKKPGDVVI